MIVPCWSLNTCINTYTVEYYTLQKRKNFPKFLHGIRAVAISKPSLHIFLLVFSFSFKMPPNSTNDFSIVSAITQSVNQLLWLSIPLTSIIFIHMIHQERSFSTQSLMDRDMEDGVELSLHSLSRTSFVLSMEYNLNLMFPPVTSRSGIVAMIWLYHGFWTLCLRT